MQVNDLIQGVAANRPLLSADLETVARGLNVSVPDVLELFARTVATRYLHGECSFAVADTAMNELFGFAYSEESVGLPEFAWRVFGAFDEGGYTHHDMAPEEQGEVLTRKLLGQLESLRGA